MQDCRLNPRNRSSNARQSAQRDTATDRMVDFADCRTAACCGLAAMAWTKPRRHLDRNWHPFFLPLDGPDSQMEDACRFWLFHPDHFKWEGLHERSRC